MNGILNVYKEPGFTSFDVVAKLRGICKQKKIGHTGTLDPDASGVLPVCLGNATKLCDMLTDKRKEYRAVLLLGLVTDTQDTTGRILSESPVNVTPDEVRRTILSFVGEIEQIPPMYSALKVNGQKLCDLARAGKEVERKARKITVYSITIEDISLPRVTMTVSCSKGTYIRTLCHDIGQALGCGGTMENLVRTRSGQFTLNEAHKLSEIEALAGQNRLEEILMPADSVFLHLPGAVVKEEFRVLADNGNPLLLSQLMGELQESFLPRSADETQKARRQEKAPEALTSDTVKDAGNGGGQIRVYGMDGRFLGVYGWQQEQKRFKPVKMFLGKDT